MADTYRIELSDIDTGQLLDGLSQRAEAWALTAEFHRSGECPSDFVVEECTDAEEADAIEEHYRSIISRIESQREAQR